MKRKVLIVGKVRLYLFEETGLEIIFSLLQVFPSSYSSSVYPK